MTLSRPVAPKNRVPTLQPRNKHTWRIAAAVALVIIAAIGALAICFPKQFKHQLDISIVRQPTPYTQLFFSDPAALPKQLKIDRINTFAFTVINDQGQSQTYHYVVTMTRAKSPQVVHTGSFTLKDSESIVQAVGIDPKYRGSQYVIMVALSGTTDFIQFYGETP